MRHRGRRNRGWFPSPIFSQQQTDTGMEQNFITHLINYGEAMRLLGKLERDADASQASYYPSAQKEVDKQRAVVASAKFNLGSAKLAGGLKAIEFSDSTANEFFQMDEIKVEIGKTGEKTK